MADPTEVFSDLRRGVSEVREREIRIKRVERKQKMRSNIGLFPSERF